MSVGILIVQVEEKLGLMILDGLVSGVLDHEAGHSVLIIYPEQQHQTSTMPAVIQTFPLLNTVLDSFTRIMNSS